MLDILKDNKQKNKFIDYSTNLNDTLSFVESLILQY